MATELRELGQLDDAKRTYETVLAKHPDHGYAWRGLGLVALAQDRPDDAIAALQTAAKLLPNVPGILTDLSQALKLGERISNSSNSGCAWTRSRRCAPPSVIKKQSSLVTPAATTP